MSVVEKLRSDFIDLLEQFLAALSETFPECAGVRRIKLELAMGVTHALTRDMRVKNENEILTRFYGALEDWFDVISKRDERFFLECTSPVLEDVNLPGKWQDESTTDDIRDCIWEYTINLAEILRLWGVYSKMDPGVVDAMQGVAAGLITPDGGIDLSAIDASTLMSLGETMIAGKTEAEAEEFARSMIASASSVLGASTGLGAAAAGGGFDVGAALGALSGAGGALSGGGGGGGMDPTAILSMLGGGGGADLLGLAMSATKK